MVGGTADNMVQLKKGSLTRLCRSGLVQDNDAVTLRGGLRLGVVRVKQNGTAVFVVNGVEQSFFDLQTRSKALCVAGQISADDLFINNQPFSRLLVRGNQMVTEPKTHRGGRGQQRGRGQRERRQQRQIREDRLDSDGHTDRRRSSSASFSSPPSVRASSAISIAPLSTQEQDRRCHRQRSLSDSFSESTNQQRGEVAEGFLSQHDSIDLHSGEENRDEDDDMNQMMCSDSSVLSEAFRTTQHLLGVLECASFPPTSEPLPQHRDLLQLQIEEEDDARVPLLDNRFSPGRTAEAFPYFVDDAISSFGSPAHLDDLAPVAYPRVVGLSLNPATPSPPHIRNRRNRSASLRRTDLDDMVLQARPHVPETSVTRPIAVIGQEDGPIAVRDGEEHCTWW